MTTSSLSAAAIAASLGATWEGNDLPCPRPAPLGEAVAGTVTFVVDPHKYGAALATALAAGAVVLVPRSDVPAPGAGAVVVVDNPRASFAEVLSQHFSHRPEPGIAETARVHPTAAIDPTAHVGEFTVIRAGATVGPHSEIRDHVVIGHDVQIGASTLVKSHAVIGEEGFGIETDADGNNIRIPHVGSVQIGDHVEVGCFTTVCSGTIVPTEVEDHVKIDDHVHIAHNCKILRNAIVVACAEVSGSVTVEEGAWVGPNAAIREGLTIGKGSLLGLGAVAVKSVPADEVWAGNPARSFGAPKT